MKGWPGAFEAMSSGLPVVASDHSAAADQATEGKDGPFVPVRDVHRPGKAILGLKVIETRDASHGTSGTHEDGESVYPGALQPAANPFVPDTRVNRFLGLGWVIQPLHHFRFRRLLQHFC